jgi:hypothetical protein
MHNQCLLLNFLKLSKKNDIDNLCDPKKFKKNLPYDYF